MKKIKYFLIISKINWLCFAQPINIIPNPSFEIYDTCPYKDGVPNYSGTDQICYATPWFQPSFPSPIIESGCGGSSDFFHACSDVVPRNVAGYQYPKSGLGYAGIGLYFFQSNDGREYIEIKLFEWAHTYQFFVLLAEIVAITSLSNSCSPKYLLLSR